MKEREIEEESQLLLTNNANNNNNSNGNNSDTNNNSESLLSMKELKEKYLLIEIDSEFQVKKRKIRLDFEQKLNDFKEKQEYDLEYYLC